MGRRYIGQLAPSATPARCGNGSPRSRSSPVLCALFVGLSSPALAQQPAPPGDLPESPKPQEASQSLSQNQQPDTIRGTVVDRDGAVVPNAHVTLSQLSPGTVTLQTTTTSDGTFLFARVPAGPFSLTVSAPGFTTERTSATMVSGTAAQISTITLHPGISSDVEVTLTRSEIAEDQIRAQEQQRVFGAIPNYYVSYVHNALPLTRKQKYELAWKTSVDPVSFGLTAVISGFQQADDSFAGYHQGVEGYSKRFGANYADLTIGTFIGGAVLPSLFHQDPRYFYKGTGSVRSRLFYAVAMSVLCKGDNGRWQVNYSGILGGLAAGGISNAYYPDSDRSGAGLTFRNAAIGTGTAAVQNIFQEFLVRKLTPRLPQRRKPNADPTPLATSSPVVPAVQPTPQP